MNIQSDIVRCIPCVKNISMISAKKISGIVFEKADEFSSHNLYHFLKKRLRTSEEIEEFLKKVSEEKKYVGCLPDNWRQKIGEARIKDMTLEIEKAFSQFASELHGPSIMPNYAYLPFINEMTKFLEKMLQEKCEMEYVGKGAFGKVFRIQCADEDAALKIYHSNAPKFINSHGATKEIANAIALNHSLKPNQCSRFYCGKLTSHDDKDSFMLTKFVDNDGENDIGSRVKKWVYAKFEIGDRREGNIIDGKITDFGAIHYNFDNSAQQQFAKMLYPLMDKGDVEGILALKKEYGEYEDFKHVLNKILCEIKENVQNPKHFIRDLLHKGYTKEEISIYKALGVDFSLIENYNYTNVTEEIVQKIKSLGISIKSE